MCNEESGSTVLGSQSTNLVYFSRLRLYRLRYRLYNEIVCLFTDLDSLYCTVILIIYLWINRTGNSCCLPVCATPHTGVEPCVGPKTIVVGFPRIVIIGLLALAKTGRRFTGLE